MLFCVEVLKYLGKCCTMNVIQAKMAKQQSAL
ncbi:hypothetical protein BN2127_JRS9_01228 [Bacillus subtilis]|nr:hypothetical protein FB592_2278 [Bacillus sp. SJZ110]CAF1828124.1 hypothetical protein NRS6131_02717 [Bacillus subtilis]CAI6236317.1 hypothetical protein NRS6131_02180 [Bacillus subtilis]CUB20770.1 hypothetical protein BN2127_JRS2_03434 [Bacillus subtilis]CUB49151.1 hypothetical protein BN2127_JRS11_02593 [Bacillus subtilis]